MRTIKFRAWDNEEKCMVILSDEKSLSRNFEGEWKLSLGVQHHDDCFDESTHDFELMQFTGLKDRNGVEICEGDVVLTDNDQQGDYPVEEHYEGVVTYSTEKAWFYIQQQKSSYRPTLRNLCIDSIEVIGNIYENPELLEKS